MFTIKYRTLHPSDSQQTEGPTHYDSCEQLHGPFTFVSQERESGYPVVYAHNGDAPGMTFGPIKTAGSNESMRPTLWVMNEAGATVAKYDL